MDLFASFYGVAFLTAGGLYLGFYLMPLWRESRALGLKARLDELGRNLAADRERFAEIGPRGTAAVVPAAEPGEAVSAERELADRFRAWCTADRTDPADLGAFAALVGEGLPGAEVREVFVRRAPSSGEVELVSTAEVSASPFWLVEVPGEGVFVLPVPGRGRLFQKLRPVYEGGQVEPAALGAIRLARAEADDEGAHVLTRGGLLAAGLLAEALPEVHHAAARLSRLHALRADYGEGLVQEAVDQIRAQYPDGAYARFEVERLPTVAAFAERVGAARTMAGLFVLLGLLFTMIRLNDVVARIAAASGQSTMDPAQFLEEMGRLMGGIGGAFDSSIYGLALLVVALVLVGAIDWVAQRRVLRVERFVVHELVPGLADLHDQLLPNLSMADLMTETRDQLRSLGETVTGLSVGLDGSLSALGDRIRDMMADFNSFETQYVRLNDLLGHMGEASTHLRDTTGALRGAAQRIADPLDAFNKTLVQHIETVADAVAATHAGTEAAERNFARLGEQVAAVQAHTEGVVEHLARVAGRQLDAGADRQQQALDEVRAQTARLHESLARVSDALDKATQVQIAGTLQRLDATVGALDERGPQTLFAWTRQGVRRLFLRSAA